MSYFCKVNSSIVLHRQGLGLYNSVLARRFYTAPVFGAGIKMKNLTSMKRSKILGKMFGGSKKKKWHTDFGLPKLPGLIQSPVPTKGPNSSRRANVLNALFMEHITEVMSTGEIGAILQGYGIEITKVKVSCDYTFLNVYWLVADCTADRDKEAERLLLLTASPIRQHLTSLRLMGRIPKVVFVRDKTYSILAEVERRLAIADFGPPDEPSTDLDCEQKCEPEEGSECQEENGEIPPADMRHDIFGLNHRQLMGEVIQLSKNSKAAHRTSNSPYSFHQTAQPKTRSSHNNSLPMYDVGNVSAIKAFMKARQIEQRKLKKQFRDIKNWDEGQEVTECDDEDVDLEESDDYDDTNSDWYKREL